MNGESSVRKRGTDQNIELRAIIYYIYVQKLRLSTLQQSSQRHASYLNKYYSKERSHYCYAHRKRHN